MRLGSHCLVGFVDFGVRRRCVKMCAVGLGREKRRKGRLRREGTKGMGEREMGVVQESQSNGQTAVSLTSNGEKEG